MYGFFDIFTFLIKVKPQSVMFLDDVFIIFSNEYTITLNQRLCGFNFVVIFLIVLVALVLIVIIVCLHCHIENPSIEDIF